jgi:hypothetical protein
VHIGLARCEERRSYTGIDANLASHGLGELASHAGMTSAHSGSLRRFHGRENHWFIRLHLPVGGNDESLNRIGHGDTVAEGQCSSGVVTKHTNTVGEAIGEALNGNIGKNVLDRHLNNISHFQAQRNNSIVGSTVCVVPRLLVHDVSGNTIGDLRKRDFLLIQVVSCEKFVLGRHFEGSGSNPHGNVTSPGESVVVFFADMNANVFVGRVIGNVEKLRQERDSC